MTGLTTAVNAERRPLAKPFRIARGTIREVEFVTVRLERDGHVGRGECCPVPYFGESVPQVMAVAASLCERLAEGVPWDVLHDESPAGAARNAVDCALWDLRAKAQGIAAWRLAGLDQPRPLDALYTIGIDTPERMAASARAASRDFPLLKVKLGGNPGGETGGEDDIARARAVRAAAPATRLIADVNEGWTREMLIRNLPVIAECGFEMIEQPLKAGRDEELAGVDRLVPIGADESCHVTSDLARIAPFYDMVNIKLDKTGGLTEALRLLDAAQGLGLETMVGCMLGTSLAMAPALLIGQRCRYADLDAPLLIGSDRDDALVYAEGKVFPASPALWG